MKVIPYPGNTYWMISLYSNRYEASTSADEKKWISCRHGFVWLFSFYVVRQNSVFITCNKTMYKCKLFIAVDSVKLSYVLKRMLMKSINLILVNFHILFEMFGTLSSLGKCLVHRHASNLIVSFKYSTFSVGRPSPKWSEGHSPF